MKVRELIEALSVCDGDLDVLIEGCDCINPAKAIAERDERWRTDVVLIEADLA